MNEKNNKINAPAWCLEKLHPSNCRCISQKRGIFCIGKTDMRHDVIDGKEHRNNFNLCIRSPAKGIVNFRLNYGDITMIAKIILNTIVEVDNVINLNYYIDRDFELNVKRGYVVIADKKTEKNVVSDGSINAKTDSDPEYPKGGGT